MTRKEEIEKASGKWTVEHGAKGADSIQEVAFEAGAEWADANNHDVEIQFDLTKKNKQLEQKLRIATEALEFYADISTEIKAKEYERDMGDLARETLAKIKE